jgi:hypothetical protein
MKQKGFTPILILLTIVVLGVVGYVGYKNFKTSYVSNQAIGVEDQIIPPPTNTSAASASTTTWKTYTNTKYGYSIKYPETWNFNEVNNEVSNFTVFIPSNKIATEFINISVNDIKNYSKYKQGAIDQDYKPQVFNGVDILKFDKREYDKEIIFPPSDKYHFLKIDFGYGHEGSMKVEVDQILSTFKFADSNKNLKTYTNQIAGIEFQYTNEFQIYEIKSQTEQDNFYLLNILDTNSNSNTALYEYTNPTLKFIKSYTNLNGLNMGIYLIPDDTNNPSNQKEAIGIKNGNKLYIFDQGNSKFTELDQIFSTFKFINR